ncbi:UNVERIFIED_CONTAM: hypothetical protein Sindi_2959100 [Sesamum indicum]
MGGGAWPFLVGGAICLVNSVNERDLSLLTSYAEVCDALRCSGPHARYTDVFNESIALADRPGSLQLLVFNEEFLVSASHQLALTTSLPFVHTARRSYRLNGPVKCSDRGDVGGSLPATSREVNLRKDHCRNLQKQTANTLQIKSGPGRGANAPVRSPPPPARANALDVRANEPPARHAPRKTERSVRRTVAPSAGCTGGGDVSRMSKRLSATDISALASMKNVAKCDTWCELQNPVNHRSLNACANVMRHCPAGRGGAFCRRSSVAGAMDATARDGDARQTCLLWLRRNLVQRLDGSRDSAIHTKYRISLRSSSMRERDIRCRESF